MGVTAYSLAMEKGIIMEKIGLHLPINSVSFGQVSTMILRTIYEREKAGNFPYELFLFPVGGVDLSSQTALPQDFPNWIQSKIGKAFESFHRSIPLFKLWHFNGSLESYSDRQTLLTFYELDNPTRVELNVTKNHRVVMSSKYAVNVFRMFGRDVGFLPLAFDSFNYKVLNKEYHTDGRIVFNLCGKLEHRKHHAKIIRAWIKKFGGNPKYALQCATYNVFLGGTPQDCDRNNNELIRQLLNGMEKPFNVAFLPHMRENAVYNDFLNSANIIIGMSGGEGWGLPEFQSIAMGKHAVLLNAHAYQTWATEDMVTFVQPSGKISSVDNMFFKPGEPYNQGQIFDWSEDEFVAACEVAIAKVETNKVNSAGLSLQQNYTNDALTDNILKLIHDSTTSN